MRRFSLLLLSTLVVIVLPFCSGCTRDENTGHNGPLSIPTEGNVRVISTKVSQTANELHWKWSLIGERNWVVPAASDTALSLAQTYAVNGTERHDGTNIWEVDLTAQKTDKELRWSWRIHGVNGTTRDATGTAPLPPASSDTAVQIELDRDSVERLPADVTLARIAGKPVNLRIAR